MFGNPAKKLNGCLEQAAKALKAERQEAFERHLAESLELIETHDKEASLEFLGAMFQLGLMMLDAGQGGRSLTLMQESIERAERFDRDRTAFYAYACRLFAYCLRAFTEGQEQLGRELLEKGLRRALEGDKSELLHLLDVIPDYLEELKTWKLAGWIPDLLRRAQAAYDRTVGPDFPATGAMFTIFAAAMVDEELAQEKKLALEAIERAYRIYFENKTEEEPRLQIIGIRAHLLQENGRAEEAAQMLRDAFRLFTGGNLAELAAILGRVETTLARDPAQIEAIVQLGLEAAQDKAEPETRIALLGMKGFCAGLRGDTQAVAQCARQAEPILAALPDSSEKTDKAEATVSFYYELARGLHHGGLQEAALKIADRAIQGARALEEDYHPELQNALTLKARILGRLGRYGEAETLLFENVLERLDDINKLDTHRHADALVELGGAWIEKGDHGRAREALKNAWAMSAEREGKDSEMAGHIYVMMGKLLLRMNKPAQAKEVLLQGRAALQAHGGIGFRAREVFEEYRRVQAGAE